VTGQPTYQCFFRQRLPALAIPLAIFLLVIEAYMIYELLAKLLFLLDILVGRKK
jgi:hypothetical protein